MLGRFHLSQMELGDDWIWAVEGGGGGGGGRGQGGVEVRGGG